MKRRAGCPVCRRTRVLVLGLAAAAAWAVLGLRVAAGGEATSPLAAAAQRAAGAASAVAARAAATAATAASAAATVSRAASAAANTAAMAAAAAASAAALPSAAASAVLDTAGAAAAASAAPGTARPRAATADGGRPATARPAAAATSAGTSAGTVSAASPATATVPATSPNTAQSASPGASATALAASAPSQAASGAAPCIQVSDGSSFCADTLRLVFKTVALPAGRLGAAYGPRQLVQGGTPPYALSLASGKLPPGLQLSDDGRLSGLPSAAGVHRFTLTVRDASTPPLHLQQPYALRVDSPRPRQAAAPASAPASAPPTLTAVGKQDAQAVASLLSMNIMRTYKLSADDVKKLATPPPPAEPPPAALPDTPLADSEAPLAGAAVAAAPAAAASAPGTPPEPRPTPDQLQDMLAPPVDVDYPTRALFEAALEARRCAYFTLLVGEAARKQGLPGVPACPINPPQGANPPARAASSAEEAALSAKARQVPTVTSRQLHTVSTDPAAALRGATLSLTDPAAAEEAATGARSAPAAAPPRAPAPAKAASAASATEDSIALDRLYAMLLPAGLQAEIVATAQKLHDMTQALPVHWAGKPGCGCVPRQGRNDVYGFYPYWSGTDAEQNIDFSLFTRLGYFGAVLSDAGDYILPPHWNDQRRDFTRAAHRHGSDVDLVIYRRDWPRLLKLGLEEEETFIRKAAAQAVALADAPLTDRFSRLKGVLLPGWTERTHLFSGITVFFDDLPTEPAQVKRFHGFFRRFMDRLIAEMQRTGRNYALSIVMPDHALGDETGPFNFADLLGYIEAAEQPTGDKLHDGRYRLNYKGTSDMTVLFLVLLSEPTSPAKKALRARLDNSDVIQGHQRVAFLESMLPVMFHPTGDKPGPLAKPRRDRLDIDLAYVEWQFGGVGFWPVPMDAVGAGADVASVLAENSFLEGGSAALSPLCSRVCPNRSVLRLMFEGLLLLGVVSLGAYAWICEVRRLGLKYLLYLWAGGAVTVLLGMALLSCDPDLAALRKGDYLFYGLIVALVAGGLYVTFKPRVELP